MPRPQSPQSSSAPHPSTSQPPSTANSPSSTRCSQTSSPLTPSSSFDRIVSPANSYGRLDGPRRISSRALHIAAAAQPLTSPTRQTHTRSSPSRRSTRSQRATRPLGQGRAPSCRSRAPSASPTRSTVPDDARPEGVAWNQEIVLNCAWS